MGGIYIFEGPLQTKSLSSIRCPIS